MTEYLPVDRYGRLARMTFLKGFPQSAGFLFDIRGRLDRERLATALEHVIRNQHPVAGCRIARYLGIFYRWKRVPFASDAYFHGPFQELRDFDAFREPPFRIHLGDDTLAFEMSHVAFDGVGLARLVRSIMEQYDALPRVLPPTLDEVSLRLSGDYWGEPPRKKVRNPGRRFRDQATGRVLSRRADQIFQTGEIGALGTLLKHVALPLSQVRERARSQGCTINDLYVSALLTQIARWNQRHGARTRYLSVDAPANLRPPDRPLDLAANASGHFTVNILNPDQGTPRLKDMIASVSRAFLKAKEEKRQWTRIPRRATLRYPSELTVLLGRWLLQRLSGWLMRFAPTAIVSNFGRVPWLTGEFAGVRLQNMRVLGTAFVPITFNTCSPEDDTCMLSFCVRKSHFRPETLEQFASELSELILKGD